MNGSTPVRTFSAAGLALLLVASLLGIIGDDGGRPYRFVSLRGESVEIYGGEGLYQYDTVSKATVFRGFDWGNLFVCIPLLAWGAALQWRGRLTGQLLVSSVFAYLAYNYLIGVMGNAFNSLFLIWTGLFSVGVFGLAFALAGVDIAAIPERMKGGFPRRSLSIYMTVLGLYLFVQYASEILAAYRTGRPPASLGIYTTLELAALELAIMVPLHIAGGILLWRKRPLGYLLGIVLVFTAFMTFVCLAAGSLMSQVAYGRGSVRDVAIPLVLTLVAAGFSAAAFRQVDDRRAREAAVEQGDAADEAQDGTREAG